MFVGALVSLDADGTHGQEHGKGLTDEVIKPRLFMDLLEEDVIGLAGNVQLGLGYRSFPKARTSSVNHAALDELRLCHWIDWGWLYL